MWCYAVILIVGIKKLWVELLLIFGQFITSIFIVLHLISEIFPIYLKKGAILNLTHHHFQLLRPMLIYLLNLNIWHHLNFYDIHNVYELLLIFGYWQAIFKNCKSNFYVSNPALKFIVWLWDISRYLKCWKKGGPQYVVSAYFLINACKGKIGTANPSLFVYARSIEA